VCEETERAGLRQAEPGKDCSGRERHQSGCAAYYFLNNSVNNANIAATRVTARLIVGWPAVYLSSSDAADDTPVKQDSGDKEKPCSHDPLRRKLVDRRKESAEECKCKESTADSGESDQSAADSR